MVDLSHRRVIAKDVLQLDGGAARSKAGHTDKLLRLTDQFSADRLEMSA